MSEMILLRAHAQALYEEMARDDKVICIGEDIGPYGGIWKTFSGLQQMYGDGQNVIGGRVLQMPMEEAGYSLFACGAAMMGYRPVVEIMYADFSTLAFEAIVDVAAKFRYNAQGKNSLPITFILPQGVGAGSGAHHSQSVESWYANVPGLKIVAPSTPTDVRAFLRASIEDDDPVLFIWHRGLMMVGEEVPDVMTDDEVPALTNAAKVVKEGADLTVVAYQRSLVVAQMAAAEVEKQTGKTIEIIDPRVLIPFDKEAMFKSLKKTGRLLVAHDAPERGGFGAQIITWAVQEMGTELKGNPVSVCGKNIVIPFNKLEDYVVPNVEEMAAGMVKALGL